MADTETVSVTLRRPRKLHLDISDITTEISHFNSTLADGTLLNLSTKSVPEVSEMDTSQVTDLRQELTDLRREMSVAHEEIANLNSECGLLKSELARKICQINALKKISNEHVILSPRSTPHKTNTPVNTILKKLTDIRRKVPRLSPINNALRISPIKIDSPSPPTTGYRSIKYNNVVDVSCTPGAISSSLADEHPTSGLINILSSTQAQAGSEMQKSTIRTSVKISPPTGKVNDKRHKILLLADEAGRGIGKRLQKLVGANYVITSIVKSNAMLDQVVDSCSVYCKDFAKSDFVIIMAGSNDKTPLKAQSYLYYTIGQLKQTNVLVCKIYRNNNLNIHSLNTMIRHVCECSDNVEFVSLDDGNDSEFSFDRTIASRLIYRDFLRVNYRNSYRDYMRKAQNGNVKKVPITSDKSSQTKKIVQKVYIDQETQTDDALQADTLHSRVGNDDDSENVNNLFRV